MADQTERLLLQVDAATELLRKHLSEGEQPLDRFERRATKMVENVDRAIGGMGSRFGEFSKLAESAADRAQRSFESSFSQVQKLAATAIKGPTIDGRINLGADDIRAGAAAAQEKARSFQLIGEAAERAALKEGDASEATRLFIAATSASRIEAERQAAALLAEAGALERVEIELRQSADATELFVTKHQRLADAAAEEQRLALTAANAAAEQRGLAASAALLRAEIDPMYAAQQRFDAELTRADALLEAKIITEREHAQAVQISRAALTAHAQAVAGTIGPSRELTQSTGAVRAAMQGASYQVQDTFTQLSMGANVFQVVAIQGGQLAGQFSSLEGRAGSFARFMIGPYGLAITAALLVTGALTKDLDLFGDKLDDATDKLKEDAAASDLTRRAKVRFSASVEGVIAALKEQDEALKQSAASERSAAERANIAAKAKRDQALATRQNTAAQLADALAQEQAALEAARAQQRYGKGEAATVAAQLAAGRVDALQAALGKANTAITDAERQLQVTRVDLAAEQAQIALDPVRAVTKLYDDRIAAVKRQQREEARLGKIIDGNSYRQIEALERQKKAAVDTAQARQAATKRIGNNNQIGRTINVAEATQIAESIGGHVTSGYRSRAKQEQLYADKLAGRHQGPVAKPGTSDHERGQAIDIGFAPGLTVAKIREAFAKEGVAIKQLLVERDQKVFHVAFGKAAPRGPSQTTVERQAETARQKLLDDDTAYNDAERAARQKLLDATRRTAESEEQRDALLRESITAEADATERKIANQFDAGDISLAQAQHLYSINEATRSQRLENVKIAAAQRTIGNRYEAEQQALDVRVVQLRLEQDLAITARDRRTVGFQILELEQEIRRKRLEQLRDTSNDPAEVGRATRELAALPRTEELERNQEAQRTASPLDQYRDRLKAATSDMGDSIENAAVRGFGALEDAGSRATASAVTNLLHLKGVAGDVIGGVISDLARLAIQKAIVKAIGGGFFGLADGGSPGDLPGYASGGSPGGLLSGPGTGRSDSILALLANGKGAIRVSTGEFIMNEQAVDYYGKDAMAAINARRMPRFADGGFVAPMPVMPSLRSPSIPSLSGMAQQAGGQLTLRVALSEDLHATIDNRAAGVAVQVVRQAAPDIIQTASVHTMMEMTRPGM